VSWRRCRFGSLALTGAAGVVAAHVVGYAVVYPGGHERAVYLYATGHGYWPFAVAAALVATSATLSAALCHGWLLVHRPRRTAGPTPFWLRLAGLATWQMLLFGAMETLERLHTGASPTLVLSNPEFAIGLALQVAVAFVALVVTQSVERLGSRMATAFDRRSRHVPQPLRHAVGCPLTPRPSGWSSGRSRAPPATVLSNSS